MNDIAKKTSYEVGSAIAIGIFGIGLSFNAGVQYARINAVQAEQEQLAAQQEQFTASETPIQVRLDHIETMLSVIQSEQRRNNKDNDPPPK